MLKVWPLEYKVIITIYVERTNPRLVECENVSFALSTLGHSARPWFASARINHLGFHDLAYIHPNSIYAHIGLCALYSVFYLWLVCTLFLQYVAFVYLVYIMIPGIIYMDLPMLKCWSKLRVVYLRKTCESTVTATILHYTVSGLNRACPILMVDAWQTTARLSKLNHWQHSTL